MVYVPISLYAAFCLLIENLPVTAFSVHPDGNAWPSFVHIKLCGVVPLTRTSILTDAPCFTLIFACDARTVASECKKSVVTITKKLKKLDAFHDTSQKNLPRKKRS